MKNPFTCCCGNRDGINANGYDNGYNNEYNSCLDCLLSPIGNIYDRQTRLKWLFIWAIGGLLEIGSLVVLVLIWTRKGDNKWSVWHYHMALTCSCLLLMFVTLLWIYDRSSLIKKSFLNDWLKDLESNRGPEDVMWSPVPMHTSLTSWSNKSTIREPLLS